MIPVHDLASRVLADLIRRQPASNARTAFAWQVAVGPALARATSIELADGVLWVSASDPRWLRELVRARPIVLQKMQQLLGADQITRISPRHSSEM